MCCMHTQGWSNAEGYYEGCEPFGDQNDAMLQLTL